MVGVLARGGVLMDLMFVLPCIGVGVLKKRDLSVKRCYIELIWNLIT